MAIDRSNAGGRPGDGKASNAGVGFHSKRIQAGLSTQIVISVNEGGQEYTIGALQTLNYSQNRSLNRIKEIGTDAVIGIVPNAAAEYQLTVSRLVFDFQRLPQALQREYRHIHAQRRPFDIVVTDYNSYMSTSGNVAGAEGGGFNPDSAEVTGTGTTVDTAGNTVSDATVVKTTFRNCWFTSMEFTYSATDYMITENASLYCEHVFDNEAPVTVAGERDALEAGSAAGPTANAASVLSAFDAEA